MKNSLVKIEAIIGLLSVILASIFLYIDKRGYIPIILSIMIIVYSIIMISKRKEHVYYNNNIFMYAFSLFCKLFAYIALIFIVCSYPKYDLIYYISSILFMIYGVLAYINNKQGREILSIYIYFQVLTIFFTLIRY